MAPAAKARRRKAGLKVTTGQHCRECGQPLSALKTIERRMCRSCWRVHRVVNAS
jgi:hypothetical protein